eukprot:NODE_1272_length_1571_cov_63.911357_g1201_i0.p1 GENE.NODE_1272_length_1571_cov_63.911357_g1201_i0~~NODE_1272_length_1571_cov_63.911357_g1201_i0.p1  ORF type:complete len:493 (+),score=84.70 NODE_1272_length_1571_cov_63.911357_g1201_i0:64-1479(+)
MPASECQLQFEGGGLYTGDTCNGMPHGKGTFVWPNGDSYLGDWVEGLQQGWGVFRWANGDSYAGSWVNDQSHGKGKMFFANGDIYEGDWVENKMEGFGVLKYKDGRVQSGTFKANQPIKLAKVTTSPQPSPPMPSLEELWEALKASKRVAIDPILLIALHLCSSENREAVLKIVQQSDFATMNYKSRFIMDTMQSLGLRTWRFQWKPVERFCCELHGGVCVQAAMIFDNGQWVCHPDTPCVPPERATPDLSQFQEKPSLKFCLVHAFGRSLSTLYQRADGSWRCMPGVECNDKPEHLIRHQCSVHGEYRSHVNLEEVPGGGGWRCKQDVECRRTSGRKKVTAAKPFESGKWYKLGDVVLFNDAFFRATKNTWDHPAWWSPWEQIDGPSPTTQSTEKSRDSSAPSYRQDRDPSAPSYRQDREALHKCSEHGNRRHADFLQQNEDGSWRCKEGEECKKKDATKSNNWNWGYYH